MTGHMNKKKKKPKNRKKRLIIFFSILAFFLIWWAWSWIPVTEYMSFDFLEGDDKKIRMALITDLHSCYYGKDMDSLYKRIDKEEPDLIMISGDYFDDVKDDDNGKILIDRLAKKYPCYYVSGNHEQWSGRLDEQKDYLRSVGVRVLEGECETVAVNGAVQALDTDFLVFSGHKMLAPLGIGVLYGKREILNKMTPFIMGGDMIEYVYEQETTFAPLPNKFEAGTQNVEGVIGLGAAIDYIENLGYDKIHELEVEVLEYAKAELSKLDYLTLYLTPNRENHSGVISFNINGVHPHDVASILDSEGVCVRSGNHCAQPLMRFLGIDSTCRASFYIYNTKEDVDRLVAALNKAYEMFKKYIKK